MKRKTTPAKASNKRRLRQPKAQPTTFGGHLNELKTRLFWVGMTFIVSSAMVYPFFEQIVSVLMSPLQGTTVYYFTPAGGLSFIIKICMYVGIIGATPAFIYHLYRFIQPVMSAKNARTLVLYTSASAVLAAVGVLFTYNFIVPTAIGFLTNFEIANVQDQLGVDSYMSFVIIYIIAGAFLFQLPLIMLMINGVKPLKPKTLLLNERYVLVGAFIVGAIVSPTPDVVNQSLLAMPIIVMYQVGIGLVMLRNRSRRHELKQPQTTTTAAGGYAGVSGPSLEEILAELPHTQDLAAPTRARRLSPLIEVPQAVRSTPHRRTSKVAVTVPDIKRRTPPVSANLQRMATPATSANPTATTKAAEQAIDRLLKKPIAQTKTPAPAPVVAPVAAPRRSVRRDMQFAVRSQPRRSLPPTPPVRRQPVAPPQPQRTISRAVQQAGTTTGSVRRTRGVDGFSICSFGSPQRSS